MATVYGMHEIELRPEVDPAEYEEWFADRGHLQAWMRASDRDERRFDRAWCVLRTG